MKKRVDVLLVERGLAETRSQAQALVLAGRVRGFDKPGQQVSEDVELEVSRPAPYVSRGGEINPGWSGTLCAHTRNGGWHLYYHVDREVPNSVDRLAKGVDVRGDGGYVVSPPTPGWRWANPGTAIAEIPYHFLVSVRGMTEDWQPFVPAEESVYPGTRNDYLARFTGWLIHAGLHDFDELLDAVERENERIVTPPLPEGEVRQTVRSIGRYR